MSSLLKALKQQQSPLLNEGSALDPQLMDRRASGSYGSLMVGVVLILVCCVALALIIWQLMQSPALPDSSEQTPAGSNYSYQWGEPQAIENISWQVAEQPIAAENAISQRPTASEAKPVQSTREPLDMSVVSAELLAKFEQAVQQSDKAATADTNLSVVPPLNQLDKGFRQQIPGFTYDSHMYVSKQNERWIEFNGQRLFIGDDYDGLTVERIEPQQVILSLQGKAFRVEALRDWSLE
ncbi:MAG: general secretion pathway protein GspB [Pseudomonadota bacterium]